MPNEVERKRWNDEQMVANWPKRELFTNAVVKHVVNALDPQPGEKVLDIGCGGGNLSIAIGQRVLPRGKVTGADISLGMTKLAGSRAEAASLKNVAFEVCDMQVEKPSGGPFDAATSQFGVMFFEDPVAAFTNIRKNLKRGGRLVFGCWQRGARNSWCVLPILVPFMANPPQPSNGAPPPGPFALGDAKYTRDILERAGFAQVTRTPKTIITRVPPDAVVDRSVANAWGVPPERHEAAFAAIDKYMNQFAQPDGRLRMELKVQIFSAINA